MISYFLRRNDRSLFLNQFLDFDLKKFIFNPFYREKYIIFSSLINYFYKVFLLSVLFSEFTVPVFLSLSPLISAHWVLSTQHENQLKNDAIWPPVTSSSLLIKNFLFLVIANINTSEIYRWNIPRINKFCPTFSSFVFKTYAKRVNGWNMTIYEEKDCLNGREKNCFEGKDKEKWTFSK